MTEIEPCPYCGGRRIKHIIQEGSRLHVHRYHENKYGACRYCSEKDCEDNHGPGQCIPLGKAKVKFPFTDNNWHHVEVKRNCYGTQFLIDGNRIKDRRIDQNIVYAPFTDDQVKSLNEFQTCGFVHPFTCGVQSSEILIATRDGWKCPVCMYRQDWAHRFMADWSWKNMKLDLIQLENDSIKQK